MKNLKTKFAILTAMFTLCFALTGCGNSDNNSTSGNNNNNNDNAVENAADDVGNAVEDVADGVGNAVDDLVGNNGFDNYNDAHDYFMDTMSSYHSDAQFELRNEDKNLNDYQEGSKGYHFTLYNTKDNADGELFGEFYVDANSGQIFQKDKNGKITEYPVTNNGNNNNNDNSNNGNSTNNQNSNNNGNNTNNTTNDMNNSNTTK